MRNTFWAAVVGLVVTAPAPAYIHFPPMALPKICKESHVIRVIEVTKFDRDKAVVVFEEVESLKGPGKAGKVFRQHFGRAPKDAKAVLDWAEKGRKAVMFTIEGGAIACGYVFIDDHCYSVDHNRRGDHWAFIRMDPEMSKCYHGPVAKLPPLVKDLLAGKKVDVPTKEPAIEYDKDKRFKEVQAVLEVNRK